MQPRWAGQPTVMVRPTGTRVAEQVKDRAVLVHRRGQLLVALLLPPGHDAWAVGDQACTFVEFSKGNDYYA